MQNELKLCPLCSANAKIIKQDSCFKVKCTVCKVETSWFDEYAKEIMIEFWNSRPIENKLKAKCEELEKENRELRK